eukprot:scpid96910/ scgid14601/ 
MISVSACLPVEKQWPIERAWKRQHRHIEEIVGQPKSGKVEVEGRNAVSLLQQYLGCLLFGELAFVYNPVRSNNSHEATDLPPDLTLTLGDSRNLRLLCSCNDFALL